MSVNESMLANAKRDKISSLSSQCNSIIVAGFSIKLSDGNIYTFKLTTEDQLNLMLIENRLAAGDNVFIYHSAGQPCRFYCREDMQKIIAAFRKHVLYHTTYFNAAKQYIKSATDIDKVNLFSYGMDVSSFIDPALRYIIKNGGVS